MKSYRSYIKHISDNIYYDQSGFLVCENCVLGRTGIYKYLGKSIGLDTNEIVEVLRESSEVFAEDSLKSLEGRPVTYLHPNQEVTIDNVKNLSKGEVYNIRAVGENIVGDIIIKDKAIAEKILKKEIRELSLGYNQDIEYDRSSKFYKVKNIIYNHLALVKKGRAGNAMILDNNDIVEEVVDNEETEKVETEVVEEKVLDTETVEVEEKVEEEVEEEVEETKEDETEEVVEDTCEKEVVEDTETKETETETDTTETEVEETKEKESVEKEVENEPTEDKCETIDNEKMEEKEMIKDTAYFLNKQEEIAKVEDVNMRKKLSMLLDNEMKLALGANVESTVYIKDTKDEEEKDKVKTYEEEMQDYYDKFNPSNYENPNDALAFFNSEKNFKPKAKKF